MLAFGRDIADDFALAESREWLCTNGIGGFAFGTIAGSLARRYHGVASGEFILGHLARRIAGVGEGV